MNEQWRKRKRNQNEQQQRNKKDNRKQNRKKSEHSKTNTVDLVKRRLTHTYTQTDGRKSTSLLGGRIKCTLRNVPVYRVAQVMWNIHLLLVDFFLSSTETKSIHNYMWFHSSDVICARDSVFRVCARFFIRLTFLLLFIRYTYTFIYTLATSFNSYMVRVCISTEPIEPTANSESKIKKSATTSHILTHNAYIHVFTISAALLNVVHVFDNLNKLKKHTVSKYLWISVAARLIRTDF